MVFPFVSGLISRLFGWLKPWYLVAALLGTTLLFGLLYRNALSQLASAEADCERDRAVELNEGNNQVFNSQAAALEETIADLREALSHSDQVARDAVARANAADEKTRLYRSKLNAIEANDQSYAAWAATALPAGLPDRLREAADPAAGSQGN